MKDWQFWFLFALLCVIASHTESGRFSVYQKVGFSILAVGAATAGVFKKKD